ncbi:MAG: type II secretion system protein [Bacillota bacterium]
MLRFRWQRMASDSGYSLIELLVVTMILMILSLFSVPIYDSLTDRARLATSLQDMRVIEQALEAYRADKGFYPERLNHLREDGYLQTHFEFKTPWSTKTEPRYYFYAINYEERPTAFFLGVPGIQLECSKQPPRKSTLSAAKEEPIPCGVKPEWRAPHFAESEPDITLRDMGGNVVKLSSLSGFRESCDPKQVKDMRIAPACVVKTES